MNTARTRLAIAELTATLINDFDLPVLLDTVAADAQRGFDAYSVVVVLLDHAHTAHDGDVHVVAQALREPTTADLSFQCQRCHDVVTTGCRSRKSTRDSQRRFLLVKVL